VQMQYIGSVSGAGKLYDGDRFLAECRYQLEQYQHMSPGEGSNIQIEGDLDCSPLPPSGDLLVLYLSRKHHLLLMMQQQGRFVAIGGFLDHLTKQQSGNPPHRSGLEGSAPDTYTQILAEAPKGAALNRLSDDQYGSMLLTARRNAGFERAGGYERATTPPLHPPPFPSSQKPSRTAAAVKGAPVVWRGGAL
jgi:hypothetical protein